jgi:hypothetical protein
MPGNAWECLGMPLDVPMSATYVNPKHRNVLLEFVCQFASLLQDVVCGFEGYAKTTVCGFEGYEKAAVSLGFCGWKWEVGYCI